MIVLAIETSSERGSLAVWHDGRCTAVDLEPGPGQSATALQRLSRLLSELELSIEQIDAIAFGSGPGMFTGLRLGCGLAQGLAIGLARPVVSVSSLQALAERCSGERILAATDARMGEVYVQSFCRTDGALMPMGEAACVPPEQVPPPPADQRWKGIGCGFSAYRARLPAELTARVDIVDSEAVPHACEVAEIGRRKFSAGSVTPLSEAVPDYVRNKVALTTLERLARGGRA